MPIALRRVDFCRNDSHVLLRVKAADQFRVQGDDVVNLPLEAKHLRPKPRQVVGLLHEELVCPFGRGLLRDSALCGFTFSALVQVLGNPLSGHGRASLGVLQPPIAPVSSMAFDICFRPLSGAGAVGFRICLGVKAAVLAIALQIPLITRCLPLTIALNALPAACVAQAFSGWVLFAHDADESLSRLTH